MKNKILLCSAIAFAMSFASCNNDNDNPLETNEEQIWIDQEEIVPYIDTLLIHGNMNTNAIPDLINKIQGYPSVEDVELDESGLCIKFKEGGELEWLITKEDSTNIEQSNTYCEANMLVNKIKSNATASSKSMPLNQRACIINQMSANQNRTESNKKIIDYLKSILSTSKNGIDRCYSIDYIPKEKATLNFFRDSLTQYGIIFLITHGSNKFKNTVFATGQEVIRADLKSTLKEDWKNKLIRILKIEEKRNNKNVTVEYYGISNKYFDNKLTAKFPNSYIHLGNCYAMSNDCELAKSFVNKGAGYVIGYKNVHDFGLDPYQYEFELLMNGKNLFETQTQIKEKYVFAPSVLNGYIVYPETGRDNYYLVEKTFATPSGTWEATVTMDYSFISTEPTSTINKLKIIIADRYSVEVKTMATLEYYNGQYAGSIGGCFSCLNGTKFYCEFGYPDNANIKFDNYIVKGIKMSGEINSSLNHITGTLEEIRSYRFKNGNAGYYWAPYGFPGKFVMDKISDQTQNE